MNQVIRLCILLTILSVKDRSSVQGQRYYQRHPHSRHDTNAIWAGSSSHLRHNNNSTLSLDNQDDKVLLQVYYECLCPDCKIFDKQSFVEAVENLFNYLNIRTYPYGNAMTIPHNGHLTFRCQHGPPECYGNKLHACALYLIPCNKTALLFNACLMSDSHGDKGSNDNACNRCGAYFHIDPEPIKQCAKSSLGTYLLNYYGIESKKANFKYVPYVLINGKEFHTNTQNLIEELCKVIKNPPPFCV